MVDVLSRIDGWWNDLPRQVIQREISRVLVLNLSGKTTVLGTAADIFVLDSAFVLIEGHPVSH